MKRKQCLSFLRLTLLWHLHLSPLTNSSEKQGGVDSFSLPLILPFKHGNSWLTACCALFRRHGLGRTGRGMQEEGGGEKREREERRCWVIGGQAVTPTTRTERGRIPPPRPARLSPGLSSQVGPRKQTARLRAAQQPCEQTETEIGGEKRGFREGSEGASCHYRYDRHCGDF